MILTKLRERHCAKARFGMFRQAGKYHRNVEASMFATRTGNHHSVTVDPAIVSGRVQRQGHFRPGRKGRGTAKFDAVFMKYYRVRRK